MVLLYVLCTFSFPCPQYLHFVFCFLVSQYIYIIPSIISFFITINFLSNSFINSFNSNILSSAPSTEDILSYLVFYVNQHDKEPPQYTPSTHQSWQSLHTIVYTIYTIKRHFSLPFSYILFIIPFTTQLSLDSLPTQSATPPTPHGSRRRRRYR